MHELTCVKWNQNSTDLEYVSGAFVPSEAVSSRFRTVCTPDRKSACILLAIGRKL